MSWWRGRPRWLQRTIVTALVVLALTAALGAHTLARLEGWLTARVEPAELVAALRPHMRVERPAGEGPFPTALLFHGCDGPKDNMDRWAGALRDAGWAAVIVDSFAHRDLSDGQVWRLVCLGQLLPGGDRAGDVLAAMAEAAALPFVDEDRLALIGMSHGGWAIMELLTLTMKGRLPLNLAAVPPALEERGLLGLRAVVLVYPWCGLANRGRRHGWAHDAPTLFVLAGNDIIAPADDCLVAISKLQQLEQPLDTLMLEGVTHGFDQQERSALSPLVFDESATAAALNRAVEFLSRTVVARDPKPEPLPLRK